jgi:hypothetical protein
MELTAENVEKIFMDCLFDDKEVVEGWPKEELTPGSGVMTNCGFNKKRLEAHRQEISELLDQLPEGFKQGWSFLNMCVDKNGVQWGEHPNMDQLVCLGTAIGKLKLLAPREMWGMLPGGMPYYQLMEGGNDGL